MCIKEDPEYLIAKAKRRLTEWYMEQEEKYRKLFIEEQHKDFMKYESPYRPNCNMCGSATINVGGKFVCLERYCRNYYYKSENYCDCCGKYLEISKDHSVCTNLRCIHYGIIIKNTKEMNELKITKERVLEAAEDCSAAKSVLKKLFPEAFVEPIKPLHIDCFFEKELYENVDQGARLLDRTGGTEIGRILQKPKEVQINYQKGIHYMSLYNQYGKWIIDKHSDKTTQLIFIPDNFYTRE
jgi:hypothetical protein